MSKPVKDMITQEYRARYDGVSGGCLVSVIGLNAISTNRLRGELGHRNLRLQVIKNSLARRAFAAGPLAPLTKALEGPCALVSGGDSIIDVAKALVDLQKTYPQLELKVGILEGDPELIEVQRLAKRKSRKELLGDLAMLMMSPGRALAGCLASPGGRLAGCVKTLADRQEGQTEGQP